MRVSIDLSHLVYIIDHSNDKIETFNKLKKQNSSEAQIAIAHSLQDTLDLKIEKVLVTVKGKKEAFVYESHTDRRRASCTRGAARVKALFLSPSRIYY